MDTIRVVLVTIPQDEAETMARALVEERLAACVNVVPKLRSFYWWEGKVQEDDEAMLLIKTTEARFDALMEYVREEHPYELPEALALAIEDGNPDYIQWVKAETGSEA